MNLWPFRRRDARALPYTDAIVQAAVERAEGTGAARARDTAIATAASNAAGRAFELAQIEPGEGMGAQAVAAALSMHAYDVARSLVLDGEALYELSSEAGMVMLRRASSWDVLAGRSADERTWTYRTYTSGPGGTSSRQGGSDGVLHFRLNPEAISPWRGRSPLDTSTGRALAAIERAIGAEADSPFGYILSPPAAESVEYSNQRQEALKAMRGGLVVMELARAGAMPGEARGDYRPHRAGFSPPESLTRLRTELERSVANSLGLPIELVSDTASSSSREGYRRWLFASVMPLARTVSVRCAPS